MTTAQRPHTPFFGALESLRGIAALLVVVYHLPAWLPALHANPIVRNGYMMVELFFVLSGFVIYHRYMGTLTDRAAVGGFLFLRLGRVYPVHLLFLLLFLALEVAKAAAGADARQAAFSVNNPRAFLDQVFLIQAIGFDNRSLTFNGPAWSISAELVAYVVFAIAAWRAPRHIFLAGVAALSLVSMTVLFLWKADIGGHKDVLSCLAGFSFGCIVAEAFKRWGTRGRFPIRPLALVAALIVFLVLKPHGSPLDVLMYPLSAALILSLLTTPSSIVNRVLALRPLLWLGTISYSLYMAHAFVQIIVNQVLLRLKFGPAVLDGGIMTPQLSTPVALLVTVLTFGLIFAVSALCHRYIEERYRRASRDLLASGGLPWQSPGTAASKAS